MKHTPIFTGNCAHTRIQGWLVDVAGRRMCEPKVPDNDTRPCCCCKGGHFSSQVLHVDQNDWLDANSAKQAANERPAVDGRGRSRMVRRASRSTSQLAGVATWRCTDELSCSRITLVVTSSRLLASGLLSSAAVSSTKPSHDTLLQPACVRHPCPNSLSASPAGR